MSQAVDIGSKRLISLAPQTWVHWLLNDSRVEFINFLAGDFQWVSRATDVLMRARHVDVGEFLILNEMQLHYNTDMPRRMRAYAALAEERYKRVVYPVLVNILSPGLTTTVPTQYRSELMGLVAQQDYRVINLWEIDAGRVLADKLLPLFPFVPIMDGGQDERVIQQALDELRAAPPLADLEPLMAFVASFVLDLPLVQQMMRWDMSIVRQSPWYVEILEEGRVKGVEEGRVKGVEEGRRQSALEMLVRFLEHRLGPTPDAIGSTLAQLSLPQLESLVDEALDAVDWQDFQRRLPTPSQG